MKKIIIVFLIALFSSCESSIETFIVSDGILIENVTIISTDKNGEIGYSKGFILTDASKIIFSGERKPNIKGTFDTVNGNGKYAIPGLIDSHVHLNNIAGISFRQRQSEELLVHEYFERLPKNFLYFGYTTLIDVDNYAPNTINNFKDASIRPEIYTCAKKVQVMDDFEMVINEYPQNERYELPFLYDKYNENIKFPDSINLKGHSATNLISEIVLEDNICVKTLYEDASSGFKQVWEVPSVKIMEELVAAAHNEGLPVIIHATSYEGQKFAVETGIDIIAHAMWNWTAIPQDYLKTDLPETHEKLLLEIAAKNIGYQPTFRVILGEKDILDDNFKNDKTLQFLYTTKYLEWLQSEDAQWSRNRILARPKFLERMNPEFFVPIRSQFNSDEDMFAALYKSLDLKIQKVMKLLSENNANFLFSTDNGAMNMYTHAPGYNGYLEMKHWDDAGVPLNQIFKAATYNNAKAFGLLESIGTISSSKTANILILNSNPLDTIGAYDDIEFVIINGKFLKRAELSANSLK